MCWDTFGVVMIHRFFRDFSSLVITKEGTWHLLLWEFFWHLFGVRVCSVCKMIMVERDCGDTGVKIIPKVASPMRFHQVPSFVMTKDENSRKKQWIITPKVSQHMNLYECPEHVDLSTPCLIILVTINAIDIVWYYGVGGAPMEELILNAQYMWTHPPLV